MNKNTIQLREALKKAKTIYSIIAILELLTVEENNFINNLNGGIKNER